MFEVVAIWFATIISAVIVVKKTEKPSTELALKMHNRQFIYRK